MLEELLYSLSSPLSWLPDPGSLSEETLPLSLLFSSAGALILSKFTGTMGGLTLPLNVSALFIGSMLSNWLLQGLDLRIDQQIHQPLFVSMAGMILAAFAMMWWIQDDRTKV
jgi:H+/Cl- antiporter ClcA